MGPSAPPPPQYLLLHIVLPLPFQIPAPLRSRWNTLFWLHLSSALSTPGSLTIWGSYSLPLSQSCFFIPDGLREVCLAACENMQSHVSLVRLLPMLGVRELLTAYFLNDSEEDYWSPPRLRIDVNIAHSIVVSQPPEYFKRL